MKQTPELDSWPSARVINLSVVGKYELIQAFHFRRNCRTGRPVLCAELKAEEFIAHLQCISFDQRPGFKHIGISRLDFSYLLRSMKVNFLARNQARNEINFNSIQQPVNNKCMVQWLRGLARLLSVVHNKFCVRH